MRNTSVNFEMIVGDGTTMRTIYTTTTRQQRHSRQSTTPQQATQQQATRQQTPQRPATQQQRRPVQRTYQQTPQIQNTQATAPSNQNTNDTEPNIREQLEAKNVVIPNEYICPITMNIMKDPVMLEDGNVYENEAITRWLRTNNKSPVTNMVVNKEIKIKCITIKKLIQDFIDANLNK